MDHAPLAAWESFYVIVGSSAAALIGMQFVVMTLADARKIARIGTISAFSTPTVVHMSAALIISALMSAPWPSLRPIAPMLVGGGLIGLIYSGYIVPRRASAQTDYQPVWQDWLWYSFLPSVGYFTLVASGFVLIAQTEIDLFAIGGAALGLLLIGVHNAWDSVTHIVVTGAEQERGD